MVVGAPVARGSPGPLHIPPEVRSPNPGLYPDDLAPFVPGSGLRGPKTVGFVPGYSIYAQKNLIKSL